MCLALTPSILFICGVSESISLNLNLSEANDVVASIAVVKCTEGPLYLDRSLFSQVSVMTTRVNDQSSLAISAASSSESYSLLNLVQQHTKYLFTPLVRLTSTIAGKNSSITPIEVENLSNLQRKLREMTLALEQCQHSTMIPHIKLPVPDIFEELHESNPTGIVSTDLKRFLEKYVPSHVDAYLGEIGLLAQMGDSEADKEEFANNVNKYAKQWPAEIMKQTKLTQSAFPKSASMEIDFWKDFSEKMTETKEHLETIPVLLTKLILKRTNRVSEEMIREAETDLEKTSVIVLGSYGFLRDFPIELVLSASGICPSLETAVTNCLRHFNKLKFAGACYDLERASSLLDSLGCEVNSRLLSLLQEMKVMKIPLDEFLAVQEQCEQLFRVWEQEFAGARLVLTDKNRKSVKLKFKTTPEYASLRDRLHVLSKYSVVTLF